MYFKKKTRIFGVLIFIILLWMIKGEKWVMGGTPAPICFRKESLVLLLAISGSHGGEYNGRNITPSLDDCYKYTRGWEGKTAKR
jgi:hypothetical protein